MSLLSSSRPDYFTKDSRSACEAAHCRIVMAEGWRPDGELVFSLGVRPAYSVVTKSWELEYKVVKEGIIIIMIVKRIHCSYKDLTGDIQSITVLCLWAKDYIRLCIPCFLLKQIQYK